ncbi:hypothetical protein H5410_003640 [Solanum commersonii]|uniref:Uncharacterized protein n=1 Tax=Solanum commersonii TaxID=4109 RepID=A0A9J6B5N5_SOLCO|nr:hypothetical protein H5410_003640 [Solanum commersonii]
MKLSCKSGNPLCPGLTDHSPFILQFVDWNHSRPDFILATQLKFLKGKLKEWNATSDGSLERKKNDILGKVAQMDLIMEQTSLIDYELAQRVHLDLAW